MGTNEHRPQVLLVTTDRVCRRRLRALLEDQGVDVLEAKDPLHGIRLLEREHPDAVIVDVSDHPDGGVRVLTRMTGVPVIALAMDGNEETELLARRAGA